MNYVIFFSCSLVIFILWWLFVWRNRKHKTKLHTIGLTILASIVILMGSYSTRVLPGSKKLEDYYWSKHIFGTEVWMDLLIENNPERDFPMGDGRTIYVFQINQETAINFVNSPKVFFEKHPFIGKKTDHYVQWTQTPINENEKSLIDFNLFEFSFQKLNSGRNASSDLEKQKPSLIHKILLEKGNYYAYWYYHSLDFPQNSTLYILSPKRRLLFVIYSDT